MSANAELVGLMGPQLELLLPQLDERSRRLVLGAVARAAGDGGIGAVAQVTGASWQTVANGAGELASGDAVAPGRVRRPGGGKAIPYGVYDLGDDSGFASVGTDHDTAAFAAESVRRWWQALGKARYPGAARMLVTCDAGGSNGYRARAWKAELARFAAVSGLEITICHFPPGTSKWNKIEHRLFCHITQNWRGRPLTDASP